MTKAQRIRYRNRRQEAIDAMDRADAAMTEMKKILRASTEFPDGSKEKDEEATMRMYLIAARGGVRGCALLMIQTIGDVLDPQPAPRPASELPS